MIALSLDFSNEKLMPNNLVDFSNLLNSYEYNNGFKVVGTKIVPLTSYKDNIKNNDLIFLFNDISLVFDKINEGNTKEIFYVVREGEKFNFYIDKELNSGREIIINNTSLFSGKIRNILNNIFGEDINDVYVTEIVSNHLEEVLGYKEMVADILKIVNKGDNIIVKFDKYFEKKGGNPEDIDYYRFGGAMTTCVEKIKKGDLI